MPASEGRESDDQGDDPRRVLVNHNKRLSSTLPHPFLIPPTTTVPHHLVSLLILASRGLTSHPMITPPHSSHRHPHQPKTTLLLPLLFSPFLIFLS
ncbi:hypothetical protein Pcinc_017713 [Petrolisthes cinctipes]|uniref:Uncharacterized protein n=1 Tax=Petrolisthes cinctipes TaxID=88211 RepID=A0AAE1KK60_PETCI|nr:hypothetical protein Pcinc_017713 [Petrolisthes cinctipes]